MVDSESELLSESMRLRVANGGPGYYYYYYYYRDGPHGVAELPTPESDSESRSASPPPPPAWPCSALAHASRVRAQLYFALFLSRGGAGA